MDSNFSLQTNFLEIFADLFTILCFFFFFLSYKLPDRKQTHYVAF